MRGGASPRLKGQTGEREVARILNDWLGTDLRRNWAEQSSRGGVDLIQDTTGLLDGWAIEVKRGAVFESRWWDQTQAQATITGWAPLLLYRLDRRRWRAMMRLEDLALVDVGSEHTVDMALEAWMDYVRETASAEVVDDG